MLFITRDIGITAHFCDRVAVMYAGEVLEVASRNDLFLRPRHPYTIMLMAAFSHNAKLRNDWHRSASGAGDRKSGCCYADRCPMAQQKCREQAPALAELADGHSVRCHFPVERA